MSECTCGCMCFEPKCTCLIYERWFVPCMDCLERLRIIAYNLSFQEWYSRHTPYELLVEAFKLKYREHAHKELITDTGLDERYLFKAANEGYWIQEDMPIGSLDRGVCVVIDRKEGVFGEPRIERCLNIP